MPTISTGHSISHSDIKTFAENRVNLPRETAQGYRDQVNRLSDRLSKHIAANPGFALVKTLHAGSVAKGMALRTVDDLDLAVYVKKEKAPAKDSDLVPWLAERLREANPTLQQNQFDTNQPHCVRLAFRGSGLDVDVVPVLYEGAPDDLGFLVHRRTGERILTSIPRHLEFTRTRKQQYPDHYAQVVRLMKWWVDQCKTRDTSFKCKSFLVELLVAHLAAQGGVDLSDYPRALEAIFSYMVRTGLEERIAFTDYYTESKLPGPTDDPLEVFDPVNPQNNITKHYTTTYRDRLVAAAEAAADAISEAIASDTKGRAVERWQEVLGPSFRS